MSTFNLFRNKLIHSNFNTLNVKWNDQHLSNKKMTSRPEEMRMNECVEKRPEQ